MAERDSGYFLMINIVLLIAFISLIFSTFDLTGKKLLLNLLLFVMLVVLSLISLVGIYYGMKWGWIIVVIVLSVVILDEILIYLVNRSVDIIHLVSVLASLTGLIIAFGGIKARRPRVGISGEKIEQIEKVEKSKPKVEIVDINEISKGIVKPRKSRKRKSSRKKKSSLL